MEVSSSLGFLIFQVSFTLAVAGIFIWQAIKALDEVKKEN